MGYRTIKDAQFHIEQFLNQIEKYIKKRDEKKDKQLGALVDETKLKETEKQHVKIHPLDKI